jgi:hypothetical protein
LAAPGNTAKSTGKRTVLFLRRYAGLTGGQLKVWDFFNHLIRSANYTPSVWFTPDSRWEEPDSPWRGAGPWVVPARDQVRPDYLFLAGLDWERLALEERVSPPAPVVNLLAHVRHGRRGDPRQAFLRHPAVRICVSQPVADAIDAGGPPNGPVVVIPNALDPAELPPPGDGRREVDLLVVGVKQPQLAQRMRRALTRWRRRVRVLDTHLPRPAFLDQLRRARVTLFLPHSTEGFYLPALEGMALETLVVCPDCVGNRDFCLPEVNCLRPDYRPEALVAAAARALALPEPERQRLLAAGRRTVAEHGLAQERDRFLVLMDQVDALWTARAALPHPSAATGEPSPRGPAGSTS